MGKSAYKRRNIGLTVLFLVQLALIFVVFRPVKHESVGVGPLLAEFNVDQVTGLAIMDDENKAIRLEKGDSGWIIAPAVKGQAALPANVGKAEGLLKKFAGLSRERLVTRTVSSQNRLQVGQVFSRKIVMTAGEEAYTLYLGSAPNFKTIHVRLAGENDVYLAQDLSAWEAPADKESWWETDYVKVDPESFVGLELTNPLGTIKLDKAADGRWSLAGMAEGKELAADGLQSFFSDLSRVPILEYKSAGFVPGWKAPEAVLKIVTAKESLTLEVGPKDEEKGEHVVKSSAIPFYATASSYAVKDILERVSVDLLQEQTGFSAGEQGRQ